VTMKISVSNLNCLFLITDYRSSPLICQAVSS
jgi:hypothetical protein